jgi:hypothetical protein
VERAAFVIVLMTLGAFGLAPFRLGRSLWWPLERAL